MSISNINNNQALVPKIWGRLWTLNKLVRVGHMYSFLLFYSIWSHILCYFLNWHILFFFLLLLLILFWSSSTFLFIYLFYNLNQLTFSHWCINLSPLDMIKPFQVTLPHLFINGGHHYFKWIISFQILYFLVFLLTHFNTLILATFILWTYWTLLIFSFQIPTFSLIKFSL